MADTIGKAVEIFPAKEVKKPEIDKSKFEYVTIPATDLFGDTHVGVSINFEHYTPKYNDDGQPTGEDGVYFVDPDRAGEIRRLLQNFLRGQMRVMQPTQDKKMAEVMNRGSKFGAPTNTNF